ncbi:MAG: protein disulfide oxidoreductase [Gammaproteobacteria bacterium]|nr:protein disulfide oxidoreductase [Gammaproteobacteria bacterium]
MTRHRHLTRLGRAAWQAALVLLALGAVHLYRTWDTASGQAPAFQARDLQGRPVAPADYAGRPMLVHFWASWCPVCRLEEDSIDAIAHDHPVLTVALDSGSDGELKQYMAEQGLEFTVINDRDGAIAARYGVQGVPASFVIGPQGDIRFTSVGYTTGIGLRLRLWLAGWE